MHAKISNTLTIMVSAPDEICLISTSYPATGAFVYGLRHYKVMTSTQNCPKTAISSWHNPLQVDFLAKSEETKWSELTLSQKCGQNSDFMTSPILHFPVMCLMVFYDLIDLSFSLSLRPSSPGPSGGGASCLQLRLWNFEHLHLKSPCEMLICWDDTSNDVITLGTCFSMLFYIRTRFPFALIGGNIAAQSTGSHRGIGGGNEIAET